MERGNRGNSGKLISNQPYDESVEVHDSEDVASIYTPTPHAHSKTGPGHGNRKGRGLMAVANSSSDEFDEEEEEEGGGAGEEQQQQQQQKAKEPMGRQPALLTSPNEGAGPEQEEEEEEEEDSEEEEEDSDDDEDEDEDDERGGGAEGAYHPADYDNLPVSTEIKELFQYITRYTPQTVELDHKLKPFIPDFIPAVGDIDAFIKVPRPDGVTDSLGLLVLDEPCVKQSDPTVLSLWLSEDTKQHSTTQLKKVSSVSNAQKNPRALDSWMDSISELHRSKPPATVHYSRSMPDIDSLMQEWPPQLEELLGPVGLPGANLDCELKDYVDVVCGLLDVPVYKNRVQSLHVLFTLYQEFKNSHHFKHTVTPVHPLPGV